LKLLADRRPVLGRVDAGLSLNQCDTHTDHLPR
jgi:hypothetical protein